MFYTYQNSFGKKNIKRKKSWTSSSCILEFDNRVFYKISFFQNLYASAEIVSQLEVFW